MLYGFLPPPPPGFNTGGIKQNGITTNGAMVIGPFWAADTPVNNKHNRTVTAFGDFTFSPTVWALVSDPDFSDAPLNHVGFV